MITVYRVEEDRLLRRAEALETISDFVWIDLVSPTKEEERTVELLVGIEVPTIEEMEEIEDSSRLYVEDGVVYMTALLPSHVEDGQPVMSPVTFILVGARLVTLRYHEPRAFLTFPMRAEKMDLGCKDGESVFMALLEAIVDRLADILEKVGREVQKVSRGVFSESDAAAGSKDFRPILTDIGRQGDLVSNVLDCLVSLERMFVFIGPANASRYTGKEARARIKTLARDTRYLMEHASFLSQKITFLLDATLGMIGIEQNATIKIFSVAAVVFLPPTLIASIYGMNFDLMPELHWELGYPFAIGLMVASAFASFWFFKRRGWL